LFRPLDQARFARAFIAAIRAPSECNSSRLRTARAVRVEQLGSPLDRPLGGLLPLLHESFEPPVIGLEQRDGVGFGGGPR
jgi:hypothetical protein